MLLKKDLDVQEYVQVCDEYGVNIDEAELQSVKVIKEYYIHRSQTIIKSPKLLGFKIYFYFYFFGIAPPKEA